MEYIPAKCLVTRTKSTAWFGTEYNMNIYRGCCHGCIYCDSRSDCYRVDDFDTVKAKSDALKIIRDDLRSKVNTGVVNMGAMSDPYNPFERKLELTRHALELIGAFGFGVAVATKSPLVTRDIDVLREIGERAPAIVQLTITTVDDDLCGRIEPHVPRTPARLQALEELSSEGIYSGVLLMPLLPFINDNSQNILEIVRLAKGSGARFVYPYFGVTLRDGQREHYFEKLDELFPGLKAKYAKAYGTRYNCPSPRYKALYADFANECEKLGVLYKMQDIVKSYKQPYQSVQTSFF